MTTVAEEGNKRKGDMSKDEIEQCVLDIKSWFERSTNALDDVGKASSADFQQLAKGLDVDLPPQLDFLLSECNGGLWFMEKRMLSATEIVKTVCNFSSTKTWRNDMIPFAEDGSGSEALLVYLADSGKVCEWEEDCGIEDEGSAPTLSKFLEIYRNKLLTGKCSYDEGLGVIESVGSAGSSKVSRKRKTHTRRFRTNTYIYSQ